MADLFTAAYERIAGMLDSGSFVEIGASVTARKKSGLSSALKDGDGVVTGYGTIGGRLVYVYAQNPGVSGGSIGEMHAKKISSIYSMAVNMGAPVLAIVDCAGVRVEEGNDSLYSFGRLFDHQAKTSGVVPQITALFGNCGGGMAVSAAMSDFVFMEDSSRLFVNSPNAVAGNYEEKCDTASASFQSEKTGLCDFHGTAEEVYEKVKELFAVLPQNNEEDSSADLCSDDLNRSVAGIDKMVCKAEMLMQISDDGKFVEVKKDHAAGIVTGFIRLNGRTVGAVANNKPQLCHMGVKKAGRFISFCDAFSIPVLTLTDADGFAKDMANEVQLARALGTLAFTYSNATVPMVTLVVGKAYGTAGIVMGSKALGIDLVFAYPDAKMGLMDPALMDSLTDVNKDRDVYSALYNAQRGYVDDIILPEESRQRIVAAFEMLFSKSVMIPAKKHCTV